MEYPEVLWRKVQPITDPAGNYNGFHPSQTVLPKGWKHEKGNVVLTCDIVWERDTAVTLRDGTVIYTDIFRPVTEEKVPVVISWSPYGKSNIDLPWAYNENDLSHLQKEEGVDPAVWCAAGYAVAHPDARGAYMSEGNIVQWGTQEGRDVYDYVEFLAAQDWCNGNVGMAGNSYLSIAQWFGAAQQPPHLKAIAPWEGLSDAYRDAVLQGGICDVAFPRQAVSVLHSNHMAEDMPTMAEQYPLMNLYWQDKRAELANISIPAYIVASYTNPIHTHGTFRGYREISSEDKWLRVHNSHEWVDFYTPARQKDLMRFFDHYLKGEENGWEQTPRVRYSLLNPGHEDQVDLTDTVFPPAGTTYCRFYLDGREMALAREVPEGQTVVEYDGGDPEAAVQFRIRFPEAVELAGYPKLVLFVEGKDCRDMDLFVEIGKEDETGKAVVWSCTPPNRYQGPVPSFEGRLRVSLRRTDPARSTPEIPVQSFLAEEPLEPGQVVPVEIPIRPLGLRFEAGETLVLRIGNEYQQMLAQGRTIGEKNRGGRHLIHCGGDTAGYLQLPVIR